MNELMARSLSPNEIAKELLDHSDPGVIKLASLIYQDGVDLRNADNLKDEADAAENRASEAEAQVEELTELLRDCLDELPDSEAGRELRKSIEAWL